MGRRKSPSPKASKKRAHAHSSNSRHQKKADRVRTDAIEAKKNKYANKFTEMYAGTIQELLDRINSNEKSVQDLQEEIDDIAANPNAEKKKRGEVAVAERKQAASLLRENKKILEKLRLTIQKKAAKQAAQKVTAMEIDAKSDDAPSSDEDEEMSNSDSSSDASDDEDGVSASDDGSNGTSNNKSKKKGGQGQKKDEVKLTSGKQIVLLYPPPVATAKARAHRRMAGGGMVSDRGHR